MTKPTIKFKLLAGSLLLALAFFAVHTRHPLNRMAPLQPFRLQPSSPFSAPVSRRRLRWAKAT